MNSSKGVRITPTQERAIKTVAKIKETTIDLLSKQPYQSITTNQIADEANISIGTLYKYFPNKDALLFEIAKDLVNRSSLIIKESVDLHHEKPTKELFMHQISQLISAFDSKGSYISFIVPIALKEREVYHLIIEQLSNSVLMYLAFNKDIFSLKNPILTAKMLSIAVVAIVIDLLEDKKNNFDTESVIQEIAKLIELMLKE